MRVTLLATLLATLASLSACATGRILHYPSNAELSENVLSGAARSLENLPVSRGANIALVPMSGIRAYNQFPDQMLENHLADALLAAGFYPIERTTELLKVLALNQGGFQGGLYPHLQGKDADGYVTELLPGVNQVGPVTLAADGHSYLSEGAGSDDTKRARPAREIDEKVLRFLASPGVTKVFEFPQPDYFLAYDIIEAGIRYTDADAKNGDAQIGRVARARVFLRLVDARTSRIVMAREISASNEDEIPRRVQSIVERPYYHYYGPAGYGAPQVPARPSVTTPQRGITTIRQRIPYEGGRYFTLSGGALTSGDSARFLIAPRFDYDFKHYFGIAGGLQIALSEESAVGPGFETRAMVTYLAPEVAGKLVLPLGKHFLPYIKAGPTLKVVTAAEQWAFLPTLSLGAGALIPVVGNFVIRLDAGMHLSDSATADIEDPNSDAVVPLVLIDGSQLEASIGVGVRF
jgi:hypothetical protein